MFNSFRRSIVSIFALVAFFFSAYTAFILSGDAVRFYIHNGYDSLEIALKGGGHLLVMLLSFYLIFKYNR